MSVYIALLWVVLLAGCVASAPGAPVAGNLQAECRRGQVFLTWDESPEWQGALTVVSSPRPIASENVRQATVVAGHISPGSAYDWWLNPESFGRPLARDPETGEMPAILREGFRAMAGGRRLRPEFGLFVHTVAPDEVGAWYYAVVSCDAEGVDDWAIVPGVNALARPVEQNAEPTAPIWQGEGPAPDPGAGRGKPLHLVLHAKTGRGGMEFLAFGDGTLGWREGLPFKFGVAVTDDAVVVRPTDRTWIGRMFPEGTDLCQRLTPAIHSFWYGYNDAIYDPEEMSEGTVVNYTERRLLWILDWVKRTYQTDPDRTYAFGSSLGGCGGIAACLRHPEVFAGIRAHVPIVAFDSGPGGNSEFRVEMECGGMDRMTDEGMTVKERLDAIRFVREHAGDLPFLVVSNGRQDTSIPWWKNPPFWRALQDGRHGFIAAWNDESHADCGAHLPPDIKAWNNLKAFHHIALNKSYPAFSKSSRDENPGSGDARDGDLAGYINRGLTWDEPVDESGRYEVVVRSLQDVGGLPVTVDVTPRRLQAFRLTAGQQLRARNVEADTGRVVQELRLTVDDRALATFEGFELTSPAGNRLVLERQR